MEAGQLICQIDSAQQPRIDGDLAGNLCHGRARTLTNDLGPHWIATRLAPISSDHLRT